MLRFALMMTMAAWALAQPPSSTSIQPASVEREIPLSRGSAALWQSLKKLHTRASLIMITAHPDDEDGGMLTYESRGRGTRVALLTLNRGEGGANVMSPEYFDALGLVRTMELLAAGRYYGVEQYWTRVIDYGFSKTKAESMEHWTHDRVLADVVRVVRIARPLVVTSVFVGGETDGHGNHQTAGAMAQEVFTAAADPKMFPEQIQAGLRPWHPLKQYARTPWLGRGGAQFSTTLEIPEGEYDPVLGASYAQIAREGLGFQKSQNGGGSIPKAGPLMSGYHRFQPVAAAQDREESFFDGIDTSLAGIAPGGSPAFLTSALQQMNAQVEEAIATFDAAHPERSAPALARGMRATLALIEQVRNSSLSADTKYDVQHELEIKRAQFNNALAEALGLSIAATVAPDQEPDPRYAIFLGDPETFRMAIPGQAFGVKVHVVNPGPAAVTLERTSVESQDPKQPWPASASAASAPVQLVSNQAVDFRFAVKAPADATFTRPYFTRPDIEQSYYDIRDERHLTQPLEPYPLAAWAEFRYGGVPVRMGQVVQTVKRVNGSGSVYEPLAVAPAIGVSITPRSGIVPLNSGSFPVGVVIHSNVKGAAKGSIRLDLPAGWRAEPASHEFATSQDGEDQRVAFTVTPSSLSEKGYTITAVAEYDGRQYREGYATTGYPGLRPYFLYTPATYRTTGVEVKVAPGLKIGYIMGSGDDVPAALEHLGIHVTLLSPADVASGDLSKFDAIVLGIRTYAARPELVTHTTRLLEYVKNGGVAIVQYNTPEFDHNYGPYPYKMGNDPEEVTDEASRVTLLAPSHPVFQWPNRINEKDFEGWVEERGSKWLESWDPRYQALLETHDQGQPPQQGGLLYAKYGKGVYVYNAYAFYRQMPEGVPGAYRIFANLISLPRNPNR